MARELASENDGTGRNDGATIDEDPGGSRRTDEAKSMLLNRRNYLRMGMAAAAALPAATATGGATEVNGIQFDRTLHAVDDLGLDPTGRELADSKVEAALSTPGTLIEFPEGTFKFRDMWAIGSERVGMTNVEGERPKIVTPHVDRVNGSGRPVAIYLEGDGLLFEGFDLDYRDRPDRGGPYVQILADDDLYVGDVRVLGYIYRRGFVLSVRSSGGTGLVENVSIKDGHRSGRLGSGMLIHQSSHSGTLTIRDCEVWHCASGGIYASPNSNSGDTGPVIIENCHFKNNNTASVRVGGTGDRITGCVFEQTTDREGGTVTWSEPIPEHINGFRVPRHIQFRDGGQSGDTVTVSDCHFEMDPPSNVTLDGGIRTRGDYSGGIDFRDCCIGHEFHGAPAVKVEPSPGRVTFDNCHVTGGGAGGCDAVIFLEGRDHSDIRNACISMSGAGQHGIAFSGCSGCEVRDSSIDVPGETVRFIGSRGSTHNLTSDGACSLPNLSQSADGGEGTDGGEVDDSGGEVDDSGGEGSDGSDGDGGSDDGEEERTLSNTMTVRSTGEAVDYAIEVSEGIVTGSSTPGSNVVGSDVATTISGTAAAGGEDWFWWAGEVLDVQVDDSAHVFVNGERVDPAEYGDDADGSDGSTGDDGTSGEDGSEGPDGSDGDDGSGGSDDGGADGSGDGSDDGTQDGPITLTNTSTVRSTGGEVGYVIEVTEGIVEGSSVPGSNVVDSDVSTTISGTVAAGDEDWFWFEGDVVDVQLDADAHFFVNGEQVDTADFANDDGTGEGDAGSGGSPDDTEDGGASEDDERTLSNTTTVRSTGGAVEFTIEVSEGIVDGSSLPGANVVSGEVDDTVSGSVAADDEEWFWFGGEVVDVDIDGDAHFFVNGERVDPAEYGDDADESAEDGSTDDGEPDSGAGDEDGSLTLSKTMTVRSTGEAVDYAIEVSEGIVTGSSQPGANVVDPDVPTTISGTVAPGDEEWFWFEGEVVDVDIDGDAHFFVSGERVDPAAILLPHVFVVDGRGTPTEYAVSVTGEIRKSAIRGSIEEEDVVSGGSVSGTVESEVDAFRFSGTVTSFQADGTGHIEFRYAD